MKVGGPYPRHQIRPRTIFCPHVWKIEFWYLASASESSVGSCISCNFSSSGIFEFEDELQAREPIVMGMVRAAFGGQAPTSSRDHMGFVFDRTVWLAELDTRQ